jgi:hypothetical protein
MDSNSIKAIGFARRVSRCEVPTEHVRHQRSVLCPNLPLLSLGSKPAPLPSSRAPRIATDHLFLAFALPSRPDVFLAS